MLILPAYRSTPHIRSEANLREFDLLYLLTSICFATSLGCDRISISALPMPYASFSGGCWSDFPTKFALLQVRSFVFFAKFKPLVVTLYRTAYVRLNLCSKVL